MAISLIAVKLVDLVSMPVEMADVHIVFYTNKTVCTTFVCMQL